MKRLIHSLILIASLLLISSGVQAGTVFTLLNASTATSGTAIDTNATVCETDSGSLRVVTVETHGLIAGKSVSFAAGTGAVCTGITAGNVYYVTQVDTAYKFNISATPSGSNIAYTNAGTAFTTNTSGVGQPISLGNDYEDTTCVASWTGTTPTNTTVKLYGGIDGLHYTLLDTQTVTSTGWNYTVNNYPSLYLLGEFSAKTGGDATTAVTLKCMPGRN